MHLLSQLLTAYRAEGIGQAVSTRQQRASLHRLLLRDLGDLPLSDLTPDVCWQWKATLVEVHAFSPCTIHKYLGRLRAVCRYGVVRGWLASNPAQDLSRPSPGAGRVRYLTEAERVRLLAACRQSRNPLLYAIVLVALSTGGRKNEIRTLAWEAVDFDLGVVRFLRTKTHTARAVPLVAKARTVLEELRAERRKGCAWVFPVWNGSRPTAIESPWQTAKKQAGLVDFHFHDLRHTCASYLAMSGATLREIADVLGHKSIQQSMVYAHLLPSHIKGVVERMLQQFMA